MKKIIAFNGSPRKNGNSSILLQQFLSGAKTFTESVEEIIVHGLNLEYCRGCLRCNILGRCSITGDDWEKISEKILGADVLVFASPVYFHHITAALKKLIDRFRSFVHVQITESGLIHTPHQTWKKDFILILCMGSSDLSDAKPVIDLLRFMASILGPENKLHIITATRLAVIKQVLKTKEELSDLYQKMNLSKDLAGRDYIRNQEVLEQCYRLGITIAQ